MNIALLEKEAIQAAMDGAWETAKQFNQKILEEEPENIAAINRLARVYLETGKYLQAKKLYNKVLSLDQYNPIASKNLKKISSQGKKANQDKASPKKITYDQSEVTFLEEPGKTKIVKLIRLVSPETIAKSDSGDRVILIPKKRLIAVYRTDNTYLGSLPEDLSYKLIFMIKGGNRYEAFILKAEGANLEIFIKESFRSLKFKSQPSF